MSSIKNPGNDFIEIRKATLTSISGTALDIRSSVTGFIYYEDIMSPFVTATLQMMDSGQNLIGTLPIQGGEKINIEVIDLLDESHTYELYVWKVFNRQFTSKTQTYNLSLISKEGIYNEGVRLYEPLNGLPYEIVKKILDQYLKTDKKLFYDECKYKVKFLPEGGKAHHVIQTLMQKSVPQFSSSSTSTSTRNTSQSSETSQTSIPKDTQKSFGTAGFLFFENREGFNFRSIDYYYSDGSDSFGGVGPVETYTSRPITRPGESSNRYVIEDYKFTSEINLFDQLRNGIYSTYLCFYNFSTGKYEEYTYNLADSFENMAHLGSQEGLGKLQLELSDRPTRIMSMILDHETWYNDKDPASPEQIDGGGKAEFPDYQKYYMAQSLSRRYLMENQKMEIEIPGNLKLKVGDKIKVLLPNMVAEEFRKTQKYDEENSGTYLISKIAHATVFLNNTCKTKIELIRDTSGMKEYTSKVKS